MPAAETALERAEDLAERLLPNRTPKRRMLVIVNPYATTVSDRLRNLVVYALGSRYAVEAIDTQERGHAMQICSEAASEGYDVVVAFGGDGTVNEAANGLCGSRTPLTALPGGSTNVWARTLGIPNDVVDATEHLLRMADEFEPFPVDLGRVNERHFVFAAGAGLDASVVERVDAHPYRKARFGAWYYSACAVTSSCGATREPAARAGRGRRPRPGGRDGGGPELRPVHLLPKAPDPRGRAGRAEHGLAVDGRPEARDRARAHHPDPAPPVRPRPQRDAPPPDRVAARGEQPPASRRSTTAPSPSRWTATTSASSSRWSSG